MRIFLQDIRIRNRRPCYGQAVIGFEFRKDRKIGIILCRSDINRFGRIGLDDLNQCFCCCQRIKIF